MATSWTQLNDKLVKLAHEMHIPLVGQFELTSRCNLKCGMCYVCNSPGDKEVMKRELSAKEWLSLAEQARNMGMLHLMLTGGEPLLHNEFWQIYDGVTEMGFRVTLNTNAALITEDIAKMFGRRPPSRISVTVYGATYDTYKNICGSGDSFNKALKGIDLLLANNVPLAMRTTVVKGNKDEFDELMGFAKARGVEFGVVNYVFPRREGDYTDPLSVRLSPKELAEYEEYVFVEYSKKSGNDRESERQGMGNLINPDDVVIREDNSDEAFQCEAGKAAFWITWDGRMLPCGLMDSLYTSPLESGFENAWESLRSMCSDVKVCKDCSDCPEKMYCMSCPARLKAESGFFDKPGNYLCELAKERKLLSSMRKI